MLGATSITGVRATLLTTARRGTGAGSGSTGGALGSGAMLGAAGAAGATVATDSAVSRNVDMIRERASIRGLLFHGSKREN